MQSPAATILAKTAKREGLSSQEFAAMAAKLGASPMAIRIAQAAVYAKTKP